MIVEVVTQQYAQIHAKQVLSVLVQQYGPQPLQIYCLFCVFMQQHVHIHKRYAGFWYAPPARRTTRMVPERGRRFELPNLVRYMNAIRQVTHHEKRD